MEIIERVGTGFNEKEREEKNRLNLIKIHARVVKVTRFPTSRIEITVQGQLYKIYIERERRIKLSSFGEKERKCMRLLILTLHCERAICEPGVLCVCVRSTLLQLIYTPKRSLKGRECNIPEKD